VVFDEAHQLPETATLFFGETVSTSQVLELCRDVLAEGLAHARDGAPWPQVVLPVERAARDLRLTFGQDAMRLAAHQVAPSSPFWPALEKLKAELDGMLDVLTTQAERAETIEQCRQRGVELATRLEKWNAPRDENKGRDMVQWLEAFASSLQLHQTPLSVAPIFSKQREGSPRAWIFTSATLAVKNDFTHYSAQLGLHDAAAHSWPSPFDYEKQALLYVPDGLPAPNSPQYTDAVVDAALPVIMASGGRAFLLCTTLRAVKRAAERLREEFERRKLTYPLLVQGEAGRTELLDRFRMAGNAVLIGSQSFWEGVDVRGDALSVVIIDKLPFAPPDDPVLAARIEALEGRGLNGFVHHQLPEAIITLKQGAGRLIRDTTDRGVLMICDSRLITKPYGRRIWQSLPAFKRTRELATVKAFFAGSVAEEPSEASNPAIP
jgi:ATP-dependent DNA helicase DinG